MANAPEQERAHTRVTRAVKSGRLKRPDGPCELCGYHCKHMRLVGHHYLGYDFPLDVWWVCDTCNQLLRHRHDGSVTIEEARKIVEANPLTAFCVHCHKERMESTPVLSRHRG